MTKIQFFRVSESRRVHGTLDRASQDSRQHEGESKWIIPCSTMGLLKGIDPILTADLLWALRAMGHGDRLAVVDCNFPATKVSKSTVSGKDPIILTVPLPQAVSAICELLPLDYFEKSAAFYMAPQDGVDMPPEGVEVVNELGRAIAISSSPDVSVSSVERFEFYEEAKKCFAIVQTLERRPYGNVILVKGVIGPDGEDLKPN